MNWVAVWIPILRVTVDKIKCFLKRLYTVEQALLTGFITMEALCAAATTC